MSENFRRRARTDDVGIVPLDTSDPIIVHSQRWKTKAQRDKFERQAREYHLKVTVKHIGDSVVIYYHCRFCPAAYYYPQKAVSCCEKENDC